MTNTWSPEVLESRTSGIVCLQSPSCRVPRRRRLKDTMGSGDENGVNLTSSLCDLNFHFGKGDIYLFTMPVVTWSAAVVRTINTIVATRVSWSDVTSHQSSIARSTWLGVADGRTLNLDFVVKKCQDQKLIFGILIYGLSRFQKYKNPCILKNFT